LIPVIDFEEKLMVKKATSVTKKTAAARNRRPKDAKNFQTIGIIDPNIPALNADHLVPTNNTSINVFANLSTVLGRAPLGVCAINYQENKPNNQLSVFPPIDDTNLKMAYQMTDTGTGAKRWQFNGLVIQLGADSSTPVNNTLVFWAFYLKSTGEITILRDVRRIRAHTP
jgi:hypothetical protein